jgi:hypothetical protein
VFHDEFVVVSVARRTPRDLPYLVGKVYQLGEARINQHGAWRRLEMRIYGNFKSKLNGVFRPGWYDTNDKNWYFAVKPNKKNHIPLTSEILRAGSTPLSTYNVIIAGFSISETTDKLPSAVVAAMLESVHFDWSRQEREDQRE